MRPSTIREILKLTQRSQVISFAGGLPAPELFPIEALRQAADAVLRERGREALQYSATEGYLPLRSWVAERLGASAEQVQIVSGSQQALDLIAKVLCDPGDAVAVAAPTYMGALRAFDAYEVRYLSVATDDAGIIPEALASALQARPKLLYLIPNFDNPTGATLPLARREAIVALARRYGVPIVEDDPYGELRFEGEALPSLYQLAPELVLYVGSFSKIMAPGFRLGWVVANAEALALLLRAKQAADLHTPITTQMIACELLQGGMAAQLAQLRAHYRQQRDRMLNALAQHCPSDIHWTRPRGGMFVWLTLPAPLDATALAYAALERSVAYVPGEAFFADSSGKNYLRLSYSVATPTQINQGVARLGELFTEALAQVA